MASLAMASYGERQKKSSVRVVDLDGNSPETLDETVVWLVENGFTEETNIITLHDAINKRFKELRDSGKERGQNNRVTLREKLRGLRDRYKQERQTHLPDYESGMLHKMEWLVDLPGVGVDKAGNVSETRKLDLGDALALTMPVVKVFKAGQDLETWELGLNFEYVNQQMEPTMRGFELVLAKMEKALMGKTRAQSALG
jgi:hypothetical protein